MLQIIKKYALQLLILQGFIIIGLMAYFHLQLLQYERQELKLVENLSTDYEVYEDFANQQTIQIHEEMEGIVEEEMRGEIFVTYADKIREITYNEYIQKIDKDLEWREKGIQKETSLKNAKDYFCDLQDILFAFCDSIGSYEPAIMERIFDDYPYIQGLKENSGYVHQVAYLRKTKRDIRFMENKATRHLLGRIPRTCSGCLFTPYYADFIAPYQLVEGDNYTAKVRFTQSAAMSRPMISVENKGLPLNAKGEAFYDLNTKKLGKHHIKGEITTKDRYGQIKTYPFTHEYTVLPKCK